MTPKLSSKIRKSRYLKLLILCFYCCNTLSAQSGGVYRILYSPTEALQCRIDLIQQAKNEILLSYYIIKDDVTGKTILSLLAEASRERGVKVRILIDRNGSKISKPMRVFLEKNGIEVRRFFLKKQFGLRKYYHGLHEKILIVDNQFLLVGGRNIKDSYYGLGKDYNFFDYDILTTADTLTRSARLHFYTSWNHDLLSSPYPAPSDSLKNLPKLLQNIEKSRLEIQERLSIRLNTGFDWRAGCEATQRQGEFIHDDFFIKKGDKYYPSDTKDQKSTLALIGLMDSAQQVILIENPYFIPTKLWYKALKKTLDRGVKIRLRTNSIQSNDLLIRQAAYLNQRKKLLSLGIEIWEHQGPEKLHAKTMVIDGRITVIGSYNVHRPSERYNTEVAVWVEDKKLSTQHIAHLNDNLKDAVQIGKDNKPMALPSKTYKKPPFGLRLKIVFLRYTAAAVFGWML